MRAFALIVPALIATGCATDASRESRLKVQAQEATRLDAALAGFTAGKPLTCLPNRDVHGPEAYGDRTLLFRVGRNLIYRTDTHGSCRAISRGDILVTQQFSSQLCSGDLARTADRLTGFETGSCALGPFVPYRRAKP